MMVTILFMLLATGLCAGAYGFMLTHEPTNKNSALVAVMIGLAVGFLIGAILAHA